MDESIRVHVVDKGRKYLYMRYRCPMTNKEETRSTGQAKKKEAEKIAAKWEAELQEGRYQRTSLMGWDEFREFYTVNCLDALAIGTAINYDSTLNRFERFCKPNKLGDLTTARVTAFVAYLRADGVREATVARHLRVLKAVSRWANAQGFLNKVPQFTMPKRVRGAKLMRGRPITTEEFERMLAKVGSVVSEVGKWEFFLKGLWLSGLRLSESLGASWEYEPGCIMVDMDNYESVMLHIPAEAEKGNKDRLLATTADFEDLLRSVPVGERSGKVFCVGKDRTAVGRKVSAIGKAANVVVDNTDGKLKFASAHDFRRAFGTRLARKVSPARLRSLMRHSNLQTTMDYYVAEDALETARALRKVKGDTLGDTSPYDSKKRLTSIRRKSFDIK